MAASVRHPATAQPGGLAELRLLLELPAVRGLADRGLSDQEVALVSKLADATREPALRIAGRRPASSIPQKQVPGQQIEEHLSVIIPR
jgi:hypothetical protein